MNVPLRILTTFTLTLCLLQNQSFAALIDFDDNPINFSNPSVANGADAAVVINGAGPSKIKKDDGYSITNLSYTITANEAENILVVWDSDRMFDLSANSDLQVTISGITRVSLSGGLATFFVRGTIDGDIVVESQSIIDALMGPVTDLPVLWYRSGVKQNVAAGSHELDQHSGVVWTPSAVGDTLTVSSLYESVVPVPSVLSLILLGALPLVRWKNNSA